MKYWKCSQCFNEHESKDDTIFCVCKKCLSDMKLAPYKFKKEVEVLSDHERNKIYSV